MWAGKLADKSDALVGRLCLFTAFALAGTSVVAGAMLAGLLGSVTISAVSLTIAVAGMIPFYGRQALAAVRRLKGKDWLALWLQAIFGIVLFRVLMLLGVRQTSAAEAGILTGATPAITAVLAWFALRERPSRWALAGVVCAALGIALLQGNRLAEGGLMAAHSAGNALVLCAAASESAFNVLSRKQGTAGEAMPPMVQTLLVCLCALALCLPLSLLEKPLPALAALDLQAWLVLGWYGLGITALGFMFFYAGVRRCDAYTAAAYSGVMPLAAMLLSMGLLGETPGFAQAAGGVLVIAGMLMLGSRAHLRRVISPEDVR